MNQPSKKNSLINYTMYNFISAMLKVSNILTVQEIIKIISFHTKNIY